MKGNNSSLTEDEKEENIDNNESYSSKEEKKVAEWCKEAKEKLTTEEIEIVRSAVEEGYGLEMDGFREKDTIYSFDIISNAFIYPEKKIDIYEDTGRRCYIKLKGILNTLERLPAIKVSIKQLEANNFYANDIWGIKVIFNNKCGNAKALQLDCIKKLGKNIKTEKIYRYTGFTKIDEKLVFLHNKGAIGTTEEITVDLSDENLSRYSFSKAELDTNECLKKTFKCLESAPKEVTVPLLAIMFLAPLTSTLTNLGINIGIILWINGQQQTKKTSLASAFLGHYGFFPKNTAVMTFLDSVTSINAKAGILRDGVIICDDYFPTSNKQEASEMKKVAERLITLYADKMTGGRATSSGKIRKTVHAKGQLVVTGEMIPQLSASRLSRVLFLELKRGDVNDTVLKDIQNSYENLQCTMKKYIEYIINNYEEIKGKIKTFWENDYLDITQQSKPRTMEILRGLQLGLYMLVEFAKDIGYLDETQSKENLKKYWDVLVKVGNNQDLLQEQSSPINMLISAIETLTNIGEISVFDLESAKFTRLEEMKQNGFVGYLDSKNGMYLVQPDLLFNKIKGFYNRQNEIFPLTKSMMCKELMEQGYLYTSSKQERPQIRRENPVTKKEQTFIGILADKIFINCKKNDGGRIV